MNRSRYSRLRSLESDAHRESEAPSVLAIEFSDGIHSVTVKPKATAYSYESVMAIFAEANEALERAYAQGAK